MTVHARTPGVSQGTLQGQTTGSDGVDLLCVFLIRTRETCLARDTKTTREREREGLIERPR